MSFLDTVKSYSVAAWSTPGNFRNLIAKPFDLVGKYCEYLDKQLPFMGLIRHMTHFKDMIGGLAHLQNPRELLPISSEGSFKLEVNIDNISLMAFKQWELLTYLKRVKIFELSPQYEKYLNWYGTFGGSVLSLTKLKEEWSQPADKTNSWVPDAKHFSWVRVAVNGSALALSVLYNPMLDAQKDYKLPKLVAFTVMVVAGAVDGYWKECAKRKVA